MSSEPEIALLEAIRFVGSQQELARALNLTRTRINNWLNLGIKIPFHYAEAIEGVTEGRVNRYDLAPYARPLKKLHNYKEIKK